MDIFLAGTQGRRFCVQPYLEKTLEEMMDLYLAGNFAQLHAYLADDAKHGVNILESFYYADEWTEQSIPFCKNFLLDSGAYTFLAGKDASKIDWEDYLKRYAAFIKKNDVQKFFELDIDPIVGYDTVVRFRHELEEITGRKSIPVWHRQRGMDNYIETCKQYPYVGLGGIVIKEIPRSQYRYFPEFIKIAHENGAKLHGLGFTNIEGIKKYHFDSVDSTAWTTGNRFGSIYKFTGKSIVRIIKPEGTRLIKPREAAINNFDEWVKFSEYAEKHY